ncbi:MAG TPA: tetratricopeptide repeat protein [Chthoniobacterales bacterium]
MNTRRFLAELKRRNVYKVAVGYAVVGWLVMQVAATIVPALHLPDSLTTAVVVITLLGFPIALVIAWAFEMTPDGMKRTENVSPNEKIPQWSAKKFAAMVISLALLAAALLAFQLVRNKAKPPSEPNAAVASDKSIAVLPFLNESGDPNDEYFSDGLSEELIAALAQIGELKVIGRSSSFRFKGKNEENKTIGEKLGVNTLLEGTVRKQQDHVRIVAELVNAADGTELWSRTFQRELKDIFAVQAEIADAVAQALELKLLGRENPTTKNPAPQNVEAHNVYLQGHFYFERRNLEDYRKSIGFFDEAIRLDPEYALAYAERSEAWTWIADQSGEKQRETWAIAARDAERAVAIAPHLAEAHSSLGWVRFFGEWKFDEGLAELRRAQELAPGSATANHLLSSVLVFLGRFPEAEKLARKAIELDPLTFQARANLGRILFYEKSYDEAMAVAEKAAELQPTAASSHRWQVCIAVVRRDGETALREAKLEPNEAYRDFALALAQASRDDKPAAEAALAELIAKDKKIAAYQIAEVYAFRGQNDKAFEWLQISFDTHDTGMLSLRIDPFLKGLRSDPRYHALLAKMGFPAMS